MASFSAKITNRINLFNLVSKIFIFFSFLVQLLYFIFPFAQKILLYTTPVFLLLFLFVWSLRLNYLKSTAFIVGVAFVFWYLLTRFFLSEKLYPTFYLYFLEIATAYFIYLPFAYSSDDYIDTILLDKVAILISAFITLIGMIGILSALLQTAIKLPGIDSPTDMSTFGGRLQIFGVTPNIAAMILIVSLMFEIYLMFRFFYNMIYRAAVIVCFIICYWALTLTGSRGAEYGLVIAAPFISFLFFGKYIQKIKYKFIINLILIVLSVVLTFCSFSWTTSLLSGISNLIIDNSVSSTANEDPLNEESFITEENNKEVVFQDRATIIDTTLDLRTGIYKGFFEYSKMHKMLYLIGLKERTIQTITYKMTAINQPHLHCSFLQTLALTGVLGLFFILVILVIILIYALKMFFSEELTLAERFIPVILIPMLIHSCVESYLFVPVYEYSYMMFENNVFLFISGYVIAKGMSLKSRKLK